MGEAIDLTSRLYPGLLERDPNLMFALKCRQFVEMVNGSDSEVNQTIGTSTTTSANTNTNPNTNINSNTNTNTNTNTSININTSPSNDNQTSVIQSTKAYNSKSSNGTIEEMNLNNTLNGTADQQFINGQIEDDVDMEMESNTPTINNINGLKNTTNGYQNGSPNSNGYKCNGEDIDMGTFYLLNI